MNDLLIALTRSQVALARSQVVLHLQLEGRSLAEADALAAQTAPAGGDPIDRYAITAWALRALALVEE